MRFLLPLAVTLALATSFVSRADEYLIPLDFRASQIEARFEPRGFLSGLFGKGTQVVARNWRALVRIVPRNLKTSSLEVTVPVSPLEVQGPAKDQALIIRNVIQGPAGLAADRFETIHFESAFAEGDEKALTFHGKLTIKGQTRDLDVPARILPRDDGGQALVGQLRLKLSDWGIRPADLENQPGGSWRVKDEFELRFQLVGKPQTAVAGL